MATLFALVGVQQAKADTSLLPESAGWTKVTTVPTAEDIAANYYVFVDVNNDLMLGVGKGVKQNTKWYSLGVYYYTSVLPTTSDILSKTWTLETCSDGFAMRNLEYSALAFQTEWEAAMKWDTNDVPGTNGWTKMYLAVGDGAFTIQNGMYPDRGYLGPWDDSFANGAECAGNKSGANVGKFYLYAISRERYKANLMAAASATNPVDVTPWYVTNATFDLGNRDGWTQTGSGGNNNTSYGGGCEIYHRSNFNLYQTITVPAGMYKVSIQASGSTSGTVYGTSGSNTVTASASVANDGNYQNNCLLMIQDRNRARITTDELAVANGSLTIGFKDETTNQWDVFDNFKVYYTGPITDLTPYIDAYHSALTAARDVDQEKRMSNKALQGLQDAIRDYSSGVDETSQEALETATDALNAATAAANTSIHSYEVIAAGVVPDNSLEGWVCTNTNTFHINTWSVEGNPGNDPSGMVTPFIENWTGKGGLLGEGKIYYRLEGLNPGEVYRVSCLVRSYNEASTDAPNGPNFYVNDVVASLPEVGTTFTYKEMSGIYGTQVAAATVGEDGVLELGVTIAADRNYNWVAFKNIKIATYDASLAAAIARVEALEEKVPAGAYAIAYAVVTANTGENYPKTAEQFETAIEALNQAADNLEQIAEAFSKFLELKAIAEFNRDAESDADEADAQDYAGQITAAQTAVNAATSVADVEAANAQLKADMIAYVNANNPVGDSKFKMTFMLTNPNLDGIPAWTGGVDGWYTDQTFSTQNFQTMDEGDTGKMFMEYWSAGSNATEGFVLYQQLTLPEGTYQMTAECKAGWGSGASAQGGMKNITFSANETDGSQITSDLLAPAQIEFVNATEGNVQIGLKAHEGNTCNWMGIGYVELYKIPAQAYEIGGDAWDPATEGAGDVTIARSINVGYNAYILPFNMTQEEVETAFGEGSTVKVVRTFDADNEILKFSTRQGIAANEPCLVKATAAATAGIVVIPNRTLVPATASEIVYTGEGLTMTGCYAAKTNVPQYSLFVKNAKLIYNNSAEEGASYIYSTRTYITLEGWEPGENGIKGLTIIDDDEATGIAVVENGQLNLLTGKVYDLSGRAVKNPTKGLYIIDGKKVMLK